MDETKPQIPDILTQVSKEKFRRRWVLISRIIACFLILGIFYFGYSNLKYGELVSRSPCYACGYYESKQCNYVLIPDDIDYNETQREEFLDNLGKYNENRSGSLKVVSDAPKNYNLPNFSLSNRS